MNIKVLPIDELLPYENNPRINDAAVDKVAESINEFGFKVPIVVDKDNVIVCGHTRYKAAARLNLKEIPCIVADDLTDKQIQAFRLADNKVSEFSEWDDNLLKTELEALLDFDMTAFGFDDIVADVEETLSSWDENGGTSGILADKYIIPPFSTLDTRRGYWRDRKRIWEQYINSGEGRDVGLLGDGMNQLAKRLGTNKLTGTSIFDPVLCEVLINWFCPAGGKVIDPFAGGSVRGLVTNILGNDYTGIDLSQKQIDANVKNYNAIAHIKDFNGNDLKMPNWICDDSLNIDNITNDKFDFMLTCPPYADLEVYSDDERDLSNMDYADFKAAYSTIIAKTVDKLKDDSFAAIVVGDVRDKKGYYYNFVGDTIKAFTDAGMKYYNECILLNAIASAALRADRIFNKTRKVIKTHQNVLIFVKGNERNITLNKYEYDFDKLTAEMTE